MPDGKSPLPRAAPPDCLCPPSGPGPGAVLVVKGPGGSGRTGTTALSHGLGDEHKGATLREPKAGSLNSRVSGQNSCGWAACTLPLPSPTSLPVSLLLWPAPGASEMLGSPAQPCGSGPSLTGTDVGTGGSCLPSQKQLWVLGEGRTDLETCSHLSEALPPAQPRLS